MQMVLFISLFTGDEPTGATDLMVVPVTSRCENLAAGPSGGY